jgi:hypothetical protein
MHITKLLWCIDVMHLIQATGTHQVWLHFCCHDDDRRTKMRRPMVATALVALDACAKYP